MSPLPPERTIGVARPRRVLVLVFAAAFALAALGGRGCARGAIADRVRHAAADRGLTATWRTLDLDFPLRVRWTGLALTAATGDTVVAAESLAVTLDPWRMLVLRPVPREVSLAHARIVRPAPAGADTRASEPEPDRGRRADRPDRSGRVRRRADAFVQALLLPARRLPRLALRDLVVTGAPAGDDADDDVRSGVRLDALELSPEGRGVRLDARGTTLGDPAGPFAVALRYGDDDHLSGTATFGFVNPVTGDVAPLRVAIAGAVNQDRRAGVVRIADSTRVTVGSLPLAVSATVARRGPAVSLRVAADGVTEARLFESLPRPLLGPLLELAVRGSFDYRLAFDLDLARPDSVDFHADVVPHGLALDPARTRLPLLGLEQPFTAVIHLPRGRLVPRDLSVANPHFLPLARIDTLLVHAVVANEDGGFLRHRGFNTDAVKMAIADNIHAGAYRRGAGTITMQLARNLWLGHDRTLARKGQEVVLAWVLEHLTGLGKERLLEIYFNIIEWGPDVHGADEAAHYYFGHGAERVTPDEALFLATVVPAPTRWRWRFEKDGTLRASERAQMHFIGRAMIAKGWLDPALLPTADSLHVTLAGPARDVLFPPDTTAAPADSAVMAVEEAG